MREHGFSTKGDGLWHLNMKLKNNGLTPAMNVNFYFKQAIGNPDAEGALANWENIPLGSGPFELGQGEDNGFDMHVNINDPFYKEIKPGEALITDMKTVYKDIFGKERATYYCLAFIKSGNSQVSIGKRTIRRRIDVYKVARRFCQSQLIYLSPTCRKWV